MSGYAPEPLVLRIGGEELLIRKRYEVLSILNDILVAAWFVVGSVLFFWEPTTTEGTWFFLFGSIELAVRPVIRLVRHVHLRRYQPSLGHTAYGASHDF